MCVDVKVVLVICLALVVVEVRVCCGYNLSPEAARVVEGSAGSHFGYSLAMWPGGGGDGGDDEGASVLIGAPKWNEDLGQEGERVEGERVPPTMGQLNICQPPNYTCHVHPNLPFLSSSVKSELSWRSTAAAINSISFTKTLNIGFPETLITLSNGTSPGILACASRYPLVVPVGGVYFVQPGGACYIIQGSLFSQPSLIVPFSALPTRSRGFLTVNHAGYTGWSLAGFSAAATQNQSLYVGGPFAFYGQGIVSDLSERRRNSRLEVGDEDMDYWYEGWAVVVGRFGGSQEEEVVATSAPDAFFLHGKVTFYNLALEWLGVFLKGPEYGAKFGYSLSAGDLDGDGATDLVVGAPMALGGEVGFEGGDRGKVYVYYAPTSKDSPPRPPQELVPPEGGREGGNFGLALTTVDLDQDGYQDLVVGEPGGGGAVYVYSGRPGGVTTQHSQVITASDFPLPLLGLGFSLASGTDLDMNGYPDLLIGAPYNDKAVVIRSSPVLWLRGEVRFIPEEISLMERSCLVEREPVVCFDLQLNLAYHTKRPLGELELVVEVTLDQVDGRAAFLNTSRSKLTETRMVNSDQLPSRPWRVTVYIKSGCPRHLETPLTVSVRAFLPQRSPTLLSTGVLPPPVLAPGGSLISGTTNLTCPDVRLYFTRTDLVLSLEGPSQVIIGEGNIEIRVIVRVRDNMAYLVQLSVAYPADLTFERVYGDDLIPICDPKPGQVNGSDLSHLSCSFTSNLIENSMVVLIYRFGYSTPALLLRHLNTSDLTSPDLTSPDLTSPNLTSPNLTSPNLTSPSMTLPNLTFHMEVESNTPDLAAEDNAQILTLPLRSVIRLQLIGQSQPENVWGSFVQSAGLGELSVGANLSFPSSLGPPLTHTFIIVNLGPSPVTAAKVYLQLPLYISDGQPLLYPLEPPSTRGPLSCTPLTLNSRDFKFSSTRSNATEDQDILNETELRTHNRTVTNDSSSTTATHPSLQDNTSVVSAVHPTTYTPRVAGVLNDRDGQGRATVDCQTVPCETLTCELGWLDVGELASVSVHGYLVMAALQHVSEGNSVRFSSGIRVHVEGSGHHQTVTPIDLTSTATTQVILTGGLVQKMTLMQMPMRLSWWWWAVVAATSIFLLGIIITLCSKGGFFNRNRVIKDGQENCRAMTWVISGEMMNGQNGVWKRTSSVTEGQEERDKTSLTTEG